MRRFRAGLSWTTTGKPRRRLRAREDSLGYRAVAELLLLHFIISTNNNTNTFVEIYVK